MLGAVITFTHTAAVLALGAVALAAGSVLPGVVVPVLTVAAGVVVLVLGIRLVRRRWSSGRSPDHVHAHDHGSLLTRPTGLRGSPLLARPRGSSPARRR